MSASRYRTLGTGEDSVISAPGSLGTGGTQSNQHISSIGTLATGGTQPFQPPGTLGTGSSNITGTGASCLESRGLGLTLLDSFGDCFTAVL